MSKDQISWQKYESPAWHITADNGQPFPEDELPFRRVMETGQSVFDVRHAMQEKGGMSDFAYLLRKVLEEE